MMKRPLDPESPVSESKHTRQEQSLLRDLIPLHKLSHISQDLQAVPTSDKSNLALNTIYATMVGYLEDDLKTLSLSLVNKDAFYTNAQLKKAHFFSLVTATAAKRATNDDVLALINSGMCTFIHR